MMNEIVRKTPNVFFILGGPGSGKGTQCSRLANHFEFEHFSAGELLREEKNRPNSSIAKEIDECLKIGKILPVKITCTLLENAMNESGKLTFLIDGFPRNNDNLVGWNKQMGTKTNVKGVLFFECPNNVCKIRCLERGKQSGRSDDNEVTLTKRIKTDNELTIPLIEHFDKLNIVKRIDGSKSQDEVFEETKKAIKEFLNV